MLLTMATNKQTKVVPVTGFPKEQLHEIHHSPHMTSCQLFALAVLTMSGSAWHLRAEKPLFFFSFPPAASQELVANAAQPRLTAPPEPAESWQRGDREVDMPEVEES